jgi:hypothetical protein
MKDDELDAQFADIVAHFAVDDGVEPTPEAPGEDLTPREGGPAALPLPMTGEPRTVWRSGPPAGEDLFELARRRADDGEDADDGEVDHFVPPPLEPLPPSYDHHFWGIVIGLVAGPLILLWLVILQPDASSLWTWLGVGLTVAGFVLLVLRQPKDRDESDDGIRL